MQELPLMMTMTALLKCVPPRIETIPIQILFLGHNRKYLAHPLPLILLQPPIAVRVAPSSAIQPRLLGLYLLAEQIEDPLPHLLLPLQLVDLIPVHTVPQIHISHVEANPHHPSCVPLLSKFILLSPRLRLLF